MYPAPPRLVELFPGDHFDVNRPNMAFISSKQLLDPYLGEEPIYHDRSHFHWTPLSHEITGKRIAEVILERGFLK